jgi:miniconductance mechanosensitive channel
MIFITETFILLYETISLPITTNILLPILAYYISKFALPKFGALSDKLTKKELNFIIEKSKIVNRLALAIAALTSLYTYKFTFLTTDNTYTITGAFLTAFSALSIYRVLFSILNITDSIYSDTEHAKDLPSTGVIQAVKLILTVILVIITTSIFIDRNPVFILSSLGAIAAVLVFAFKSILEGFIGGIQVISNKIISVGDWIEIKGVVDGTVTKIGLNVVTIEGWDKATYTIPTHSIMNKTIINWKGMYESNCRRIKRSIIINQNTIKNLSTSSLKTIKTKHPEISDSSETNNLILFRQYTEVWLSENREIDIKQTLLVRTLQPTENGIPFEIYTFSKDNRWREMEKLQTELTAHLILTAKEFELKIFQLESDDHKQLGNS